MKHFNYSVTQEDIDEFIAWTGEMPESKEEVLHWLIDNGWLDDDGEGTR